MKKIQKKSTVNREAMKAVAKKNTSVVKKNNDGTEEVIKNGSVADTSIKHPVPNSGGTVGMALGCTKNMGDFESLRADVWLSLPCESREEAVELYDEIRNVISEVLDETVSDYT